AAVNPNTEYAQVFVNDPYTKEGGERLIVAKDLVDVLFLHPKRVVIKENVCKGIDLVGKRYLPPYEIFRQRPAYWGTLFLSYNPDFLTDDSKASKDLLAQEDVQAVESVFDNPVKLGEALRAKNLDDLNAGKPSEWLRSWRVVAADFVTTDSGSGVVHLAPA